MKAEDAPGYFTRACAFNEIGEPQRALHDFSEALRLKPDSLNSYLGRGAAYGCAGDNEAACRDLTKALEIDPDCLQAYLGRAYVNLGLGRAASALKDVNSVLSRSQNPDSDRLYALIVGSLACRFLHNESDAARMLDEALAASQPQIWPGPIIRFLDHKIDKRAFVKEARGYSRTTEVRFYMAMDQALSGEVQEAVRNLQWVKDNGDRTFYEYPVALSQLASLQESRNHQK